MGKVKKKYEIRFETANTDGCWIQINAKAFKDLLYHYEKQIEDSRANFKKQIKENHAQFRDFAQMYLNEIEVFKIKTEECVKTTYSIYDGGAIIVLREIKCNNGF